LWLTISWGSGLNIENGPGCIDNAQMFVLVVFGVFTSEFVVECKKMQEQKR